MKIYTKVYGDATVINGVVARYNTIFYEEFDKVVVDTVKTNTAKLTKDGVVLDVSRTATLQGNMGLARIGAFQAGVFLYDEDANELLAGEVEGHKIPVSNVKYRYDVVYVSGAHGDFGTDEHLDVVVNTETSGYEGELCDKGMPLGVEGYTFAGWDKQVSQVVTSSVVYTAQWEEVTEVSNPKDPQNPTEQPDGGLAASPLGILALFVASGIGLFLRFKK